MTFFMPDQFGAKANVSGLVDDSAAFNAALSALNAVGGGELRCGPNSYGIAERIIVPGSNISITGVPGRTRLCAIGGTSLNAGMIGGNGSAAGMTTVVDDALEDTLQLNLVNAATYNVGDHVYITTTQTTPTTYYDRTMARVAAKSGNIITLSSPLPFPVLAGNANAIYKITPRKHLVLRDLILDGSGNTGAVTHGIMFLNVADSEFRGIHCTGFRRGSAIFGARYHGCTWRDVSLHDSGNDAYSDFQVTESAVCTVDNVRSELAWGFGPQLGYCHDFGITNWASVGAGRGTSGRAIKLANCSRIKGANIEASGASNTGLSITVNTRKCRLANVTAVNNALRGIWFSDQHNTGNVIDGFYARRNGSQDVSVFVTDTGNSLRNGCYGSLGNAGGALVDVSI